MRLGFDIFFLKKIKENNKYDNFDKIVDMEFFYELLDREENLLITGSLFYYIIKLE